MRLAVLSLLFFSSLMSVPQATSAPAPFGPRRNTAPAPRPIDQSSLENRSWREVFAYLARRTGKPVIHGSACRAGGPFTYISPEPVGDSASQLANFIDQALRTKGFRLIDRGRDFIVIGFDTKVGGG